MNRTILASSLAGFAIVASAAAVRPAKHAHSTVRHDLIAVYIGAVGTDAGTRMRLTIGEEHEIASYTGARDIAAWVVRGAPLPR
ncbi:MAG TPA: hypothetical protein VH277_05000 [Gemmatimonadaceae bacterium]|jgi:hypothetical protein|nr:hypothetical protein [Gemmatimonadaceae bacterium]